MRVDPRGSVGPAGPAGQAGQVDDDRTRTRRPIRLDPWGAPAPGQEFPDFQPGGRENTTMARPAAPQPGDRAASWRGSARPSGRVLALGAGVVVAIVAVVAFFTLAQGNGQPSANSVGAQSTSSAAGQSALGPGATAPGEPTVKAQSAGTQVRFSWTYGNPAAGDTFRWQRVSGSAGAASGVTSKPDLLVSLPDGQSMCIVVQVRRAAGQASTTSPPVCWPNLLIHHNN
jgi:hypothetical protein